MRLIDSDEVVRIVREEVKDEDNTLPVSFRAGVDYVLKIMNELSTVEAIPVEWLDNWIETVYKDDKVSDEEYGYWCTLYLKLKWNWYKENESNI